MVQSTHPKKVIIAGPGTGKTTSFLRLLEDRKFDRQRCIVFTFLRALREDLRQKLEEMAMVFTFHGYCLNLLGRFRNLRGGLEDNFEVFPALLEIVRDDWEIIRESDTPKFIRDIRSSIESDPVKFFLDRGNYYNAISFDDSVFRVYSSLQKTKIKIPYDLILVDEAQDFNKLEIDFILLMAEMGSTLIVGDDDQALYYYRLAKPSYIIDIYKNPNFEKHYLPYCTRCTKVIVDSFHDVVSVARNNKLLAERVDDKEFNYCPPIKGSDSEQYQKIECVRTSTYSKKLNYFGQYIEKEIRKIPRQDILDSAKEKVPTALIISANPFRGQIEDYLKKVGIKVISSRKDDIVFPDRKTVLQSIQKKPESNLWWRAIIQIDNPSFYKEIIKKTQESSSLKEILPDEYRNKILLEIKDLEPIVEPEDSLGQLTQDNNEPTVQITTFEGAKGLTSFHVFIAGLQNGVLPKDPANIKDVEVRRFLVALTRTKKHCHLLYTKRPFGVEKNPSVFLNWIKPDRKEEIYVDKDYFKTQ